MSQVKPKRILLPAMLTVLVVAAVAPAPAAASSSHVYAWVAPTAQLLGTYAMNVPGLPTGSNSEIVVVSTFGAASPELGSCSPSGTLLVPFTFVSRPDINAPLDPNYVQAAGIVDAAGAATFTVDGIPFTGVGALAWASPPSPVYGTNLLILDMFFTVTGTDLAGHTFSYAGSSGVYVVNVDLVGPGVC